MRIFRLYWFSGTGNTWLAAQALAESLGQRGAAVSLHRMEAAPSVALAPDEVLALAFPIACFSTYPVVWRFVESLPPGEGRGVVMVATMGGASAGMAGPLGRVLRAKGYRTLAAQCFAMPGNYNNRQIPVDANAARIARMRSAVAAFAEELLAGRATWPRSYPGWSEGWHRLSASPRPWRFFRKLFPLAVDGAKCTRCGLCARLCPLGCIRLDDLPVWDDRCQSCQRCVGYCPAQAIHVPNKPAEPYHAAPLDVMLGS